jgi:hypothetical protein
MFDNIEPTMVIETITWLFDEIRKIKRTDRLSVNFTDKSARLGRNYSDNYEIKFEEIIELIKFMLKYSYVKIGIQYLALQIKGLPQGAPPSPPLARLVCIKREWHFNKLIGQDSRLFTGLRYMDDVFFQFYYDTRDRKTLDIAETRKKFFLSNCYWKKWNLKITSTNTFLSSRVDWKNGKLVYKWENKNKNLLAKQRILRFIHARSLTSNCIKNNIIFSQLLRITRISDKNNVENDLIELGKEFEILGYNSHIISTQKEKVLKRISPIL